MPIPYTKLLFKDPEAPVLELEVISTIDETKREVVGAILDSGSSITLIPGGLRRNISPQLTGKETIVDIIGREADRLLYDVKIVFQKYPRLKLPVIQAAEGGFRAKGSAFAIIGRDILNSFKLVLDGPNLEFDVIKP